MLYQKHIFFHTTFHGKKKKKCIMPFLQLPHKSIVSYTDKEKIGIFLVQIHYQKCYCPQLD